MLAELRIQGEVSPTGRKGAFREGVFTARFHFPEEEPFVYLSTT
jgi:hypothetical protein